MARRVEPGREFLASTDPAFRPVNLATGPDGALYVVDMYRELVEHPDFVPEDLRGGVDFRRWHDRGRIWRIRAKESEAAAGPATAPEQAGVRDLVPLLGHPVGWWRTTAQRLLVERQDRECVPMLIAVITDEGDPLARLHALWTLAGLDAVDPAVLTRRLAGDRHPGLREDAASGWRPRSRPRRRSG